MQNADLTWDWVFGIGVLFVVALAAVALLELRNAMKEEKTKQRIRLFCWNVRLAGGDTSPRFMLIQERTTDDITVRLFYRTENVDVNTWTTQPTLGMVFASKTEAERHYRRLCSRFGYKVRKLKECWD